VLAGTDTSARDYRFRTTGAGEKKRRKTRSTYERMVPGRPTRESIAKRGNRRRQGWVSKEEESPRGRAGCGSVKASLKGKKDGQRGGGRRAERTTIRGMGRKRPSTNRRRAACFREDEDCGRKATAERKGGGGSDRKKKKNEEEEVEHLVETGLSAMVTLT